MRRRRPAVIAALLGALAVASACGPDADAGVPGFDLESSDIRPRGAVVLNDGDSCPRATSDREGRWFVRVEVVSRATGQSLVSTDVGHNDGPVGMPRRWDASLFMPAEIRGEFRVQAQCLVLESGAELLEFTFRPRDLTVHPPRDR